MVMTTYEAPSAIVVELKYEGILCDSLETIVQRFGYGELFEID